MGPPGRCGTMPGVRSLSLMNRRSRHLVAVAVFCAASCTPALKLTPTDAPVVLSHQVLNAPDPGRPGSYDVLTLYYGSGTDKNRPEYRDSISMETEPVDASKLVSLGASAKERNEYWGFTPKEMPLNARVWYPDGDGPFPLVLVVHGNHNMKDFSDPGYDYLGELLASKGYILASVDENFINGGVRQENDARGWFLLKHLELFDGFNQERGNPFFQKVDMGNIALMGHSRGGEAVANAAALNHLTHYPDDATFKLDFGYDIKGIVSIAPVDGQYLPTGRSVVMEDVSYLTFHGSHDGDVTSFHGIRIYDRLRFTSDDFHFKSAVYVYRANHGQWNTVWQNKDGGPRSARFLDLRGLIPQVDQRRFAEIYVGAFLDVVLKGDKRYLPIFRDHRVIGEWLPETMYITRLETSAFHPLATFEEDIDVTSATAEGVKIRGDSLATWKEGTLMLRSSNRTNTSASQDNQAVWLGWNNRIAGEDTTRIGPAARYSLSLPQGLAREWRLQAGTTLDLSLGATNALPGPRKDPAADTAKAEDEAGRKGRRRGGSDRSEDTEDEEKPPVDLTIQVEDRAGEQASVRLGEYGPIRRPLETYVMRRADQEEGRFAEPWEQILQSYSIPLEDFASRNPNLKLDALVAVRLIFDRAPAGEVVVDQIGFSSLDPAFLSARVEGSRTPR
jgi:dienelactone hydrolase